MTPPTHPAPPAAEPVTEAGKRLVRQSLTETGRWLPEGIRAAVVAIEEQAVAIWDRLALRDRAAEGRGDRRFVEFVAAQKLDGGDWACDECHPDSDMLIDGFRCVIHEARAVLRGSAAPAESPDGGEREKTMKDPIASLRFAIAGAWDDPDKGAKYAERVLAALRSRFIDLVVSVLPSEDDEGNLASDVAEGMADNFFGPFVPAESPDGGALADRLEEATAGMTPGPWALLPETDENHEAIAPPTDPDEEYGITSGVDNEPNIRAALALLNTRDAILAALRAAGTSEPPEAGAAPADSGATFEAFMASEGDSLTSEAIHGAARMLDWLSGSATGAAEPVAGSVGDGAE